MVLLVATMFVGDDGAESDGGVRCLWMWWRERRWCDGERLLVAMLVMIVVITLISMWYLLVVEITRNYSKYTALHRTVTGR